MGYFRYFSISSPQNFLPEGPTTADYVLSPVSQLHILIIQKSRSYNNQLFYIQSLILKHI